MLLFTLLAACQATEPTPVRATLELQMADPVTAQFVPATGILVAEFPVTLSDRTGPGGTLAFVDTTIVNRSRGEVVVTNRRPNGSFTYPDVTVPRRGSLAVMAGAGFRPTPPRDEVVVTVQVALTDGRSAERTSALRVLF